MFANTEPNSLTKRLLSPFAVLLYVYVIYFLIGLTSIYGFVYPELSSLGTSIIGFYPSEKTLLLYAYAAVVLVFGYLLGKTIAERAEKAPIQQSKIDGGSPLRSLIERVRSLAIFQRYGVGFVAMLSGYMVAMSANLIQLYIGRLSLFDIATRWEQSPVLVFISALNIMFVPGLFIFARTRGQRILAAVLFCFAVVTLGLFGARNIPAKLIVSTFLALTWVLKPRMMVKIGVGFFLILVLVMGVIGAISKAGIYGSDATWQAAVALIYSDSVGTTYNLDRIVTLTPSDGVYGGALLKDSALALLPGLDAEYANFQLGNYLGGRQYFVIDGVHIERSVSLAPTLLGAPYADWGILGVVGQMLLLGLLFGYMQKRTDRAAWLIAPFVTMASYVINGVNAGVHNPYALAYLALAIGVCVLDAIAVRRMPWLYSIGAHRRTK